MCPSNEGGNRGGARGAPIGGYRGYRRGNYQDYQGGGSNRGNYQDRGAHRGNYQGGGAHVNLCSMVGQPQIRETREMGIQSDEDARVNLVTTNPWEFCDYPTINAVSMCQSNPAASVCIYPLQYLNVTVSGRECVALVDSGCQIPVISKQLLSLCCDNTQSIVGNVILHGFGKNHTVHAPLVRVTVHTQGTSQDDSTGVPLVCAVADMGVDVCDVILPTDVVRELQATSVAVNLSSCDMSVVCDVGTETNDPEIENDTPENVDTLPISGVEAESTALVNGCSIINDGDVDFGSVLTPTPLVVSGLLSSHRVARDKLDHLGPDQHQDLLQLLDEFA